MKKILTGIVATIISSSLLAELSYTSVGIGYRTTDADGIDASGLQLSGSAAINDNLFVFGGYTDGEYDDFPVDITGLNFGLGGHTPVSEVTDLVMSVSITDGEIEGGGESADLSGFSLSVGFRSEISDAVELRADVAYVDAEVEALGITVENTDTVFSIGALFDISETIQFNAGFSSGDADTLGIGFRLNL